MRLASMMKFKRVGFASVVHSHLAADMSAMRCLQPLYAIVVMLLLYNALNMFAVSHYAPCKEPFSSLRKQPRDQSFSNQGGTLDWDLRHKMLEKLPPDKKWTQEACLNHWAGGIDVQVKEKLAGKRILFALNLRDREEALNHVFGELLLVAKLLGPNQAFFSIYESGSTDKTSLRIKQFEQQLERLKVPHLVVIDGVKRRPGQRRIGFLATVRNLALAPVLDEIWQGPYGHWESSDWQHYGGIGRNSGRITSVRIFSGATAIQGMEISYGGVPKARLGAPLGQEHSLVLSEGECIIAVRGSGNQPLGSLGFYTNRGVKLLVGDVQGGAWHANCGGKCLEDISGYFTPDSMLALSFAWDNVLKPKQEPKRFDRVLILNDGYFCAEDVLILLMHEEATMATAVDTIGLREVEETRVLMVYDSWVGRDIDGGQQDRHFPLSHVPEAADWFTSGKPIPAFCSCHGAANVDADVFYSNRIGFRERSWDGECAASEFSLFCKDIWAAYGNQTKIVMDPRVVIGVDEPAWEHVVLARSKQIPAYFNETPFDVGIQPSPWKPFPKIDASVGSLDHIPFPYKLPTETWCAPIHEESIREAEVEETYQEALPGIITFMGDSIWSTNGSCSGSKHGRHADTRAPPHCPYSSLQSEPGYTLKYHNDAGMLKVLQPKRLYMGSGVRLLSPNFRYMLLFQLDGRCAVYELQHTFREVWRWSWCDNSSVAYVEFQDDGNLVAYSSKGKPVATISEDPKAKVLLLDNHGQLVLKDESVQDLWKANLGLGTDLTRAQKGTQGFAQVLLPITISGSGFDAMTIQAVGHVCQALSVRAFFSIAVVGDSISTSRSAIVGILMKYMCSFEDHGAVSDSKGANEAHISTYRKWSTGESYSCIYPFSVVADRGDECIEDHLVKVVDTIHNPDLSRPCAANAFGALEKTCCSRPIMAIQRLVS